MTMTSSRMPVVRSVPAPEELVELAATLFMPTSRDCAPGPGWSRGARTRGRSIIARYGKITSSFPAIGAPAARGLTQRLNVGGLRQDGAMTVTARLDLAIFDAADIDRDGTFYAELTGWGVVRQDADRFGIQTPDGQEI